MSEQDHLLVEVVDGVAHITLNRPEVLNAQSPEMIDSMIEWTHRFELDAAVKCVVLRGAGRAFMAGADVKRLHRTLTVARDDYVGQIEQRVIRSHQMLYQLRRMKKPVVAVVHGAIAGIGCAFIMAADLVIARADAEMTIAYRHIGLTVDGGISYNLPRMIGERRALQLALLGEKISAREAKEVGLFNWVFEEVEFEQQVEKITRRLATGPTLALGRIKELYRSSMENSWDQQLHREAESIAFTAGTEDHLEGMTAFIEKRRPIFRGA